MEGEVSHTSVVSTISKLPSIRDYLMNYGVLYRETYRVVQAKENMVWVKLMACGDGEERKIWEKVGSKGDEIS